MIHQLLCKMYPTQLSKVSAKTSLYLSDTARGAVECEIFCYRPKASLDVTFPTPAEAFVFEVSSISHSLDMLGESSLALQCA